MDSKATAFVVSKDRSMFLIRGKLKEKYVVSMRYIMDNFFQIIGYPEWYKGKRVKGSKNAQSTVSNVNNAQYICESSFEQSYCELSVDAGRQKHTAFDAQAL